MTTANTNEPKTSTARAIGHATITFGLVSVPVKLFTTSETVDELHFNMLHDADNARLKQQYVCTQCGVVVDRDHTVKGHEHAKDAYVVFTADELKVMDAVATEQIEIEEYVPAEELDGIYIEKSYYLGPDKGADKNYALLAAALNETGHIGIGRYSARGKEYVVAVRPIHDGLMIHQLRYEREIKPWEAVPTRLDPKLSPAEIKLAKQIVTAYTAPDLDLSKYTDRIHERLKAMIATKVESGQTIAAPAAPDAVVTTAVDLMTQLKASLDAAPAKSTKATPIKAAKKKVATKKKRAA